MATKEDGQVLKKYLSGTNNSKNDQFFNLDLNQPFKFSPKKLSVVQSCSKSNNNKNSGKKKNNCSSTKFKKEIIFQKSRQKRNFVKLPAAKFVMLGYTVADNYQKKEKSWNKSTKELCFKTSKIQYLNDETEEEVGKCWMQNDKQNSFKSSTLSLHIAAYENSAEVDSKEVYDLPKKSEAFKPFSSTFHANQDLFEFPRQMDGVEENAPQIQQFKASQKLVSPNQDPAPSSEMSRGGGNMPPLKEQQKIRIELHLAPRTQSLQTSRTSINRTYTTSSRDPQSTAPTTEDALLKKKKDDSNVKRSQALLKESHEFMEYLQKKHNLDTTQPADILGPKISRKKQREDDSKNP